MRFVNQHRLNILAILKKYQLEESSVDFVKKRGRIQIIHGVSGCRFSYLRVKETTLDPITHGWKHSEFYKVKMNANKETPVENWDQVMVLFNQWTQQVTGSI